MIELKSGSLIEFDYVNWKGVFGHRRVKVKRIYFDSNFFHREEQWLMEAIDIDKGRERVFAMKDITNVSQLITTVKGEINVYTD